MALARRTGARIELVRVHAPMQAEIAAEPDWSESLRQDESEYLARTAARAEEALGAEVGTALLDGPVVGAICTYAGRLSAPLIIMSTHGRTGFSRLWLGSNADGIVRHTACPVLMLRPAEATEGEPAPVLFRNVIVPLDGSPFAERVLPHAAELARATGAGLQLVRVVRPVNVPVFIPVPEYPMAYMPTPESVAEETKAATDRAEAYMDGVVERVRRDAADLAVQAEVRVAESAAGAILEAAHTHDADAVALATHGRGLSRLVIGSVADKVLRSGLRAMLVVRPGPA
jgi:nucleotide-binding universal stress UspA family protein